MGLVRLAPDVSRVTAQLHFGSKLSIHFSHAVCMRESVRKSI
jgi:hypothetical protein